jgi:hypothetical protein
MRQTAVTTNELRASPLVITIFGALKKVKAVSARSDTTRPGHLMDS